MDTFGTLGFDIAPSGVAYASLTPNTGGPPGESALYIINLGTGAATFVGTIDAGGFPVRSLAAIIPEPSSLTLAVVGVTLLGLRRSGSKRRA